MAIAGLALCGVWVLVIAGTIAYYYFTGGFTPKRPSEPKAGDCIAQMQTDVSGVYVKTVDCATPHEGEVVAVLTMPDGDYPGSPVIHEYESKCARALITYSPGAPQDSSVRLYVRHPSKELWESHGYRNFICIATLNPPRTGSIKGAG